MVVTTVERIAQQKEPKFRNISELTTEQLTDPDYRIKKIAKEAGISEWEIIICTKCHHCR